MENDPIENDMESEGKTRFLDVTALLSLQLRRDEEEKAALRKRLKAEILPRIHDNDELRQLNIEALDNNQRLVYLRQRTEEVVLFELQRLGYNESLQDRDNFVKEILDEALGLGPLEELLSDPAITEIMVNGHDRIFVERNGKTELTDKTFASEQRLMNVIERIVAPIGRRVDESSPFVDARLVRDGSRVHIIIPPLALSGPTVTIRKFSARPLTYRDLIQWGAITQQAYAFLNLAVQQHKSIAVSGGTGTGKTTLLNILSNSIPENERIITIEDAAELRLNKINLVTLESRRANVEGKGEVAIRDLVRNALRMRPDRIVVGECRGQEAFDMLQAMNTGHEGSLTTIHANTPKDMLVRMENLVLMAAEIPVNVIRQNIASALDLIVQIARYRDGSRKISRITEVKGYRDGVIQTEDVYKFDERGVDENGRVVGSLQPTEYRPSFIDELRQRGIAVDDRLFSKAAYAYDFGLMEKGAEEINAEIRREEILDAGDEIEPLSGVTQECGEEATVTKAGSKGHLR